MNQMCVVGAPKNVLQMRQEVGRVGRDGGTCSCVFYVNGHDYSEENRAVEKLFKSGACLHKGLYKPFGEV
jgi:superfamily II DNA helicase RecQ